MKYIVMLKDGDIITVPNYVVYTTVQKAFNLGIKKLPEVELYWWRLGKKNRTLSSEHGSMYYVQEFEEMS